MSKNCLALFFKIPALGKVKTRLAVQIGEDTALAVYKQMLNDTITKMTTLQGIDLYGFYDGEIANETYPFKCYKQEGNDLGQRLNNAFKILFEIGYSKVCVIGADSPTLPQKYIYSAFKMLDKVEVVIGPTLDGGYYLIGMKEPISALFDNISWGSDLVFKQTIKAMQCQRLTYHILPKWYDIDDLKSTLLYHVNNS